MNLFTRLNDNDLLKYLSPNEVEELEKIAIYKTFEKGEIIFNIGDSNCDIFCIKTGALEAYVLDSNNNVAVFDTFYRGEMAGEINLTFKKRKYSLRVKFLSEVMIFPFKELKKIVRENAEIGAKLLAAVNDILTIKNIQLTQAAR